MIDRTTKMLLALIVLGLFANAAVPFLHPHAVKAGSDLTCSGALKANAYGGTEATIGGYELHLSCQ